MENKSIKKHYKVLIANDKPTKKATLFLLICIHMHDILMHKNKVL